MTPMPRKLRRCRHLLIEPREELSLDLTSLLSGGDGLAAARQWVALAPHLDAEVELDADELALLGACPVQGWVSAEALRQAHPPAAVERLLGTGLLIGDHAAHAELRARDQILRDEHWWSPAAVAWAGSRWEDIDAGAAEARTPSAAALIERLGPPPGEVVSRGPAEARRSLPRPASSPLDELLARRLTCRNFDPAATLRVEDLAAVLHRVFAAHGSHQLAPGAVALKKTSPSGGGLHPLEAYLLARRVDGLAPGLYHYHCVDHALEPLAALDEAAAAAQAQAFVAGQGWFADAPVLVVIAARFGRHQWKYRNHAKAYRVLNLEAGHFSQTLFLAAAELGLGAYITAAINERPIERAFGLDGLREGPLAICGFGARAPAMATFELDPRRQVWMDA